MARIDLSQCPRCKEVLKKGHYDQFCPNQHGALFSLAEFQRNTNRRFTVWFYSTWLRLKNKRNISCPACKAKMIQLNIEENLSFELDCCPSCFSLWLDSGEDIKIKELFQRHVVEAEVRDLTPDENETLGKIVLEHEKNLERYRRIEFFGRLLNVRLHPFRRFHSLYEQIKSEMK